LSMLGEGTMGVEPTAMKGQLKMAVGFFQYSFYKHMPSKYVFSLI